MNSPNYTRLCGAAAYEACRVECSRFALADSQLEECMLQFHVQDKNCSFEKQLDTVLAALQQFRKENAQYHALIARVFMSDAANQQVTIEQAFAGFPCALSLVQQAPLDGAKLSLWVYMQSGITPQYEEGSKLVTVKDGELTHLWTASERRTEGDSEAQCLSLFEGYSEQLESRGGTMYDHAVRTWLFVQNVDVNYAGVVRGRNEHFDVKGLIPGDHFISSTGIEGRSADYHSLVQLDSYSILGLPQEQIQFLYAPDYLDPTHDYGVRFERGTSIHYSDRTVSFISGTASIDNKGEVVHVGQIIEQCERMWQNVEALLAEAGASIDQSMHMIVYLRDLADYPMIRDMFEKRFPNTPKIIVLAPVCRPTWLIEMECITIHSTRN